MMATMRLNDVLERGEFVVAPGVFEMLSARIADRMGFRALYMTGYGISASYLGLADAGIATYTDMVSRARTIAEGIATPLIADADTGFGGLINVRHTVRGYEAAGVQAIQIEDQEMPKKCGHTPGRRVIPVDDMVRKIEVALDARTRQDTLIIARTDARTSLGLDEAIHRGKAYAKAGADIIFVEAPESEEEFRRVGGEIDAWLLANMVPTGKSP
ncbi:MAG: isocitrate lyase/PEP mutase family protein, partial [Pseudolabrys sp.]